MLQMKKANQQRQIAERPKRVYMGHTNTILILAKWRDFVNIPG